jgi:hypothetical protein
MVPHREAAASRGDDAPRGRYHAGGVQGRNGRATRLRTAPPRRPPVQPVEFALSALPIPGGTEGSNPARSSEESRANFAHQEVIEGHLGYRMIALEVDDMQKTADYLRTKGVDMVWGPKVRETYSRAEICDPNGYHIELRQWFG